LLLVSGLTKTLGPRQTAIDRPDYEGYRTIPQKEGEGTWQNGGYRQEAQHCIELATYNPGPHLPPSKPFKSNRKRISESRPRLTTVVTFKNPAQTPAIDALEQWHPDNFDGAKRCLPAPQGIFAGRSNCQGHIVKLSKRLRLQIAYERAAD
jgi:hypothetical protein